MLATFNQRKNVIIVESKAGRASDEDLQQLLGYLDQWGTLVADLKSVGVRIPNDAHKCGILLAEEFGFVDEFKEIDSVVFVRFKMDRKEPLSRVMPNQLPRLDAVPAPTNQRTRKSELYTVDGHVNNMGTWSDSAKRLFRGVADCFLKDDDIRKKWLVHNPKGQHIAIHYKGEYVLHLWPARRSFVVGSGSRELAKIPANGADSNTETTLRVQIARVLDDVDKRLGNVPNDFWAEWTDSELVSAHRLERGRARFATTLTLKQQVVDCEDVPKSAQWYRHGRLNTVVRAFVWRAREDNPCMRPRRGKPLTVQQAKIAVQDTHTLVGPPKSGNRGRAVGGRRSRPATLDRLAHPAMARLSSSAARASVAR